MLTPTRRIAPRADWDVAGRGGAAALFTRVKDTPVTDRPSRTASFERKEDSPSAPSLAQARQRTRRGSVVSTVNNISMPNSMKRHRTRPVLPSTRDLVFTCMLGVGLIFFGFPFIFSIGLPVVFVGAVIVVLAVLGFYVRAFKGTLW
jgi:hypothetical protein